MFDLDAQIRPGTSLAGVVLGSSIDEILLKWRPSEVTDLEGCTKYSFGSVVVWAQHGRVNQIGVGTGYRGTLPEGIGSTISQVQSAFGADVVEDGEGNLVVQGLAGWCFDTEDWSSPTPDHRARITDIFVFMDSD